MIKTKPTYLFDEMTKAFSEVDFDDASDAIGYATLIFDVATELGILLPGGKMQSREAIRTIRLAQEWIHNIDARISDMAAGDAMELLDPYNLMQIVGYQDTISKAFENEYILKAFDALKHGDKTVNAYHLHFKISKKLKQKERSFFGNPFNWYSKNLTEWHRQFKSGKSIEHLSDYDTLEIAAILLSEDLFAYEGSTQINFKKQLFDNHRHYLDKTDDLNFDELGALSRFISKGSAYISPAHYPQYIQAITAAQIARPETNRHYRLSLQHTLRLLYTN